ncbi:complement C3-like isoform X2 [Apostichopus japonicus]|uniref:complement C3-like isoform X2 n=1 Tax=Stichopus japonicus TaxID=307972 RepID=UPI003AB5273D
MALLPRYLFFFALQVFAVYGDILIATVPNLVRAGDTETVLVTIQKDNIGVARSVPVTVSFKNADNSLIAEETINIQEGVNRVNSETAHVYVNPENIPDLEAEEGDARHITVTVACDLLGFSQDKRVLLSLDGGYVFIQTDKPIYTPSKTVKTRIISLNQRLSPLQQQIQLNIRTPQDVFVERKDIAPEAVRQGVFTHIFRLPEEPMVGNWSIVVYYGKQMKSNRTVQFEVKEYVLPTFSVEIHPPNYTLPTTRLLDITVKGRYVYNKPVDGHSVLKIGVIDPDGEIEIKETDVQQLVKGAARHVRDINILGDNWFDEYVGCSLYLETTVYEEATGHFENASDTSVKIVNSPYIFSRERTVQYFKKGLPFQVKTELKYINGLPAPWVPIRVVATGKLADNSLVSLRDEHHNINDEEREITDNTDNQGEVNFNIDVPIGCEEITVNLVTFDQDLIVGGAEEINSNANLTFVLRPYESPGNGNEYLVIRTPELVVIRYRNPLTLDLSLKRQRIDIFIHVYVIARGKIIHDGSRQVVDTAERITINGYQITVTAEMIPSARIVAYFIGENNHIIADSVRIEVRRDCPNNVIVGLEDIARRSFGEAAKPNNEVQFRITAQPGTDVSLIAVDKAVLLLRDFHRLTSKKMFSTMDAQDTGCGPGGGMTSEHIFKNAGVTVMASDGPLNVGDREGTHCVADANSRRRRSLEELLEEFDNDERKIFACSRGHRRLGSGSCNETSERFQRLAQKKFPGMTEDVGDELTRIFIACCKKAESDESRERNIVFDFAAFAEIDPFDDGSVRFDFPESWAFDLVHVDSDAAVYREYTLPGSITTWSIQAFGLHENFPMCVIEPTELVVRSDLFIQLLLPYSVKRNEHVEIQAVVFNYGIEDVAVAMVLKTPPEICSEGTPNVFSAKKEFIVKATDTFTVTYVVIGVKVGEWPITVGIGSTKGSDGVRKKLNVIAEGIERTFHHSVQLNPQGVELNRRRRDIRETENCVWDAENAAQLSCLDIALPPTVVPGTESCHISITGSPLGPAMTAVVTGLGHWIQQPTGCGEQTMIRLAPNVYVLKYLLATNSGNEQIEATALSNINSGLVRETTYRHADGSFSAFLSRPGSTWLTAFVAKVFCQASELTAVDAMVPCSAISWIVNNRQRATGAFYEGLAVIHKEMTGGIEGDTAMTAFTLIAMAECMSTCDQANPAAKNSAISYLESQLDGLQRPYVIAVVTYALALMNSDRRADANIKLRSHSVHDPVTNSRAWGAGNQQQDGRPFWIQRRPSALSVETTGYALLAQIKLRELTYAAEIANWLSTQQNYGGGFVSTQDTVIALQSLSEFSALTVGGDLNLHCNISSASGFKTIFRLENEDTLLQKTVEVTKGNIRDQLLVETQGVGIGTLNVEVKYNENSNDRRELCPFNMVISTVRIKKEQSPDKNPDQDPDEEIRYNMGDKLLINIEVSYLGDTNTSMGIIDFGLFTGFTPNKTSCEKVVEDNSLVARYESSDHSVIFYTDYFPIQREGSISFEFLAECAFNVTNIHHAAVRVYDYYDPDEECIQFYTGEGSNVVQTLCNDDECTCISSECPPCFDSPDSGELLIAACVSAQTYVYHLQVTNIREEDGYKVVNATILHPIKKGDERDVHMHDSREFWLSRACRCPDIRLRRYLLIGSNTLEYTEPDGNGAVKGYRYVIDNNSIMTRWRNKYHREVRIPIRDGNSGCN